MVLAAIVTQMQLSVCQSADDVPNVEYDLTATMSRTKLRLEHRIVNRSTNSICFFPQNVDIASARMFTKSGKEIQNIANAGFVTSPQEIDIAYSDGIPHSFVSSDDLHSIFKSPADAAQISTISFEFYAYDCRSLISGAHENAAAVVHRRVTVSVNWER